MISSVAFVAKTIQYCMYCYFKLKDVAIEEEYAVVGVCMFGVYFPKTNASTNSATRPQIIQFYILLEEFVQCQ